MFLKQNGEAAQGTSRHWTQSPAWSFPSPQQRGGITDSSKEKRAVTSLLVHWLRLHAPSAGAQVPSLVRELEPASPN